ncbi:MAG: acireductone synthase [Kofleriaceae bacterium]
MKILLDIEGTTTPIAFVHDLLFPYARAHLAIDPGDAAALEAEYIHDTDRPATFEPRSYALWLMDRDRKSTALKALQGKLWRHGYESGELCSLVFDDVPPALAAWRAAGIPVEIYSSGSIEAQQLLFRYSNHGDLTPYLAGYHDTTTGPKREATSYRAIGGPGTFVSDVVEELAAANDAGFTGVLSLRPGNAPVRAHPFREIHSFAELI